MLVKVLDPMSDLASMRKEEIGLPTLQAGLARSQDNGNLSLYTKNDRPPAGLFRHNGSKG